MNPALCNWSNISGRVYYLRIAQFVRTMFQYAPHLYVPYNSHLQFDHTLLIHDVVYHYLRRSYFMENVFKR